jgi:sporulation protein YlmC with PRC-barrel domain
MDLVRDLLDRQVVDRNGKRLGRVDTIVLEIRDTEPPLVKAIEIGLVTLGERIHPFVGRCARAIEVLFGVEKDRPVRVPFARILSFEPDVKVDVAASDTNVLAFEEAARHVVMTIPGA